MMGFIGVFNWLQLSWLTSKLWNDSCCHWTKLLLCFCVGMVRYNSAEFDIRLKINTEKSLRALVEQPLQFLFTTVDDQNFLLSSRKSKCVSCFFKKQKLNGMAALKRRTGLQKVKLDIGLLILAESLWKHLETHTHTHILALCCKYFIWTVYFFVHDRLPAVFLTFVTVWLS